MSFSTALTGLHGAQNEIATTSNNIANIGTTGFKRSTAEFGDIFSTSPSQSSKFTIGSGTLLKSIKQQFTQGNLATSGNTLDIAISGQGFFTLKPSLSSSQIIFSRSGSFTVNSDFYVVDSQGQHLQVYPVNSDGSVFATGVSAAKSLQLPMTSPPPQATSNIQLAVNLPADSKVIPSTVAFDKNNPSTYSKSSSVTIYDSLGTARIATIYYVKTANASDNSSGNKWQTHVFVGDSELKPPLMQAKNSQGNVYYIDQFGSIKTDAELDKVVGLLKVDSVTQPLYKQDNQNNTVASTSASVLSAKGFDFGEANDRKVTIVTDPALFQTTQEGGGNDPNVFWGGNMFTVSIDGSPPRSISIVQDQPSKQYFATELADALTKAVNNQFDDAGKFTIQDTYRTPGGTVVAGNDILQIDLLKPDGQSLLSLDHPLEIDLLGLGGSSGTPTVAVQGQPKAQPDNQLTLSSDELVKIAQRKLNDLLNQRREDFDKPANWADDPLHPPILVGYDKQARALTFTVDSNQLNKYSAIKVFNASTSANSLGIPPKADSIATPIGTASSWVGGEALPDAIPDPSFQRRDIRVDYNGDSTFSFVSGSTGVNSKVSVGRSLLVTSAMPQKQIYDLTATGFSSSQTLSLMANGRVLNYNFTPPELSDPATQQAAFLDGLEQALPVTFKDVTAATQSATQGTQSELVASLSPSGKLMNGDKFDISITPSSGKKSVTLHIGPLTFPSVNGRLNFLLNKINDAISSYNGPVGSPNPVDPVKAVAALTADNKIQFTWPSSDPISSPVSIKQTVRGTDSTLVRVNFSADTVVSPGSDTSYESRALTASGLLQTGDHFTLRIAPSSGVAPVSLSVGPLPDLTGKSPAERRAELATAINGAISDYNDPNKVPPSPDPIEVSVTSDPGSQQLLFSWTTFGPADTVTMAQDYDGNSRILNPIDLTDVTVVGSIPDVISGTDNTRTVQTLAFKNPTGSSLNLSQGDVYRVSIPMHDGSVASHDVTLAHGTVDDLALQANTISEFANVTFSAAGNALVATWNANGAVLGTISIEQIKAAGVQVRPPDLGSISVALNESKLTVFGPSTGDNLPINVRLNGVSSSAIESTNGQTVGSVSVVDFNGNSNLLGVGVNYVSGGALTQSAVGEGLPSTHATAIGMRAIIPMNKTFTPNVLNSENKLTISVDGIVGDITLPIKAYTGDTLASAIQERVNQFETSKGKVSGVVVRYNPDQNRLEFTAGSTGPNSQINVIGSASLGLKNVTQTSGSTPQYTILAPALNADGTMRTVVASNYVTSNSDPANDQKWVPLYLDEGELSFDTYGKIVSPLEAFQYSSDQLEDGTAPLDLGSAAALNLGIDFGKTTTQFNTAFSVTSLSQDGYPKGSMDGLDIDASGTVRASYSNGKTVALGKIMVANFANPNGLQQIGNADWVATAVSGEPLMGQAGIGGLGSIKSGALEQSNVDVTDELVKLITSQRNFQASAKMIDTQKQLTETLIQIR